MKKIIICVALIAAILMATALPALAAETTETNTVSVQNVSGKGTFVVITMLEQQAYCVEYRVARPIVGSPYTVDNNKTFEAPAGLEEVFVAIHQLDDGTETFKGIAQCAIWATIENYSFTAMVSRYCNGQEGIDMYNTILETAKTVDMEHYVVNVVYFLPAGDVQTQILAIPMVFEVESDTIENPIPEPTEPEDEPEDEIPEEEPEDEPEEPEILGDEPHIPEAPQTGDNGIAMYVVAMLVSSIALACLIFTKRQKI